MRYITPVFADGRIGHQFSAVWAARVFAEAFDFTYAHSPFEIYPDAPYSKAHATKPPTDRWNAFLDLAQNEISFDTIAESTNRLDFHYPAYSYLDSGRRLYFNDLWRLAQLTPDNTVLTFNNLGMLLPSDVQSWITAGVVHRSLLRRVISWFQGKVFNSTAFHNTPIIKPINPGHHVVVYYRVTTQAERDVLNAASPVIAQSYPVAIDHYVNLLQYLYDKLPPPVTVTMLAQRRHKDHQAFMPYVDQWVYCDDNYPLAYRCAKTLLKADTAIVTHGEFSKMISMLRAYLGCTIVEPAYGYPGNTIVAVGDLPPLETLAGC